jgi:Ohr subfamily peroxiredoxin
MAPLDKVQYTAKAHTVGSRDGGVSYSSDGHSEIELSVPGSHGTGTNPEQLLAACWSTCFLSSINGVADRMKFRLPQDLAIDAEVDLCKNIGGLFIQARINVSLPGVQPELAQALVDEADQMCPYSKATRGNIAVAINVATSASNSNVATHAA